MEYWFACLKRGFALFTLMFATLAFSAVSALATPYGATIPDGNGSQIPNTFPEVGGTVVVLEGANGNLYYQFVNPSTQFQGRSSNGTPTQFRGNPFQLGPTQALNCGPTACVDYFGGSITKLYVRLTVRDADACPGNFDFNDITFELNGFDIADLSNAQAERTNRAGTISLGFENCFRDQRSTETSTGWFTSTNGALLNNVLATGGTTPRIRDADGGGDNFWFFRDGNDATGATPEVAPGISIVKTANRTSYTAAGDDIEYSFEVRNIGSVILNNVAVTDTFISNAVSCPATTLAVERTNPRDPTQTDYFMTCTATHTVSQQNIDDDEVFVNTARVTAVPTEGSLGAVSGTLTIPGPDALPSLTIVKSASPATPLTAGETVTYTYDVTNNGNITIDNVAVTDDHSGSGTLSAITRTPVSPDPVTIGPGLTQRFTATYEITQDDFDAQVDVTNTAFASGTARRGTLANSDPSSASVSMDVPNNDISLQKLASPQTYSVDGETINYAYTITNDGNTSLTGATISDSEIPGGIVCPAPPGGKLIPGDSYVCSGSDTIEQQDIDDGQLTNGATVDGTFASGANATSDQVFETVTAVQNTSLTIEKALTGGGPRFSAVGEELVFSYTVTNRGNVSLTTVSVVDTVEGTRNLPVQCNVPVGGVKPGDNVVCTSTYSVIQEDIDNGSVTNEAAATGNGVSAPDTASVTVPADQNPALSMVKTARPISSAAFLPLAVATYDYVVTNVGNTTIPFATPITVTDSLIPAPGVVCDPLPVGGLLPLGEVACIGQYTITVDDVLVGTVTNIATATDGNVVSPPAEATIPDAGTRNLELVKTSTTTDYSAVGDTIDYTFVVTNRGTTAFVTPIIINDPKINENPLTCFPGPGTDLVFAQNDVATCFGTHTVIQQDLDDGSVINEAIATAISGSSVVSSAPSTATVDAVQSPSIVLTKTASPANFGAPGTDVTYTLTARNDGNVTLTNVTITDPKLSNFSCPTVELSPTDPPLVCTGTYTVQQEDFDLGTLQNDASVTSIAPNNAVVSQPVTLVVDAVAPNPAWSLTKNSASTVTAKDDIAVFEFTLRNTGNVTIESVSLADPLCITGPNLTSGDGVELGVGEEWLYSCEVQVTQDQVDSGSVVNNATAVGDAKRGDLPDAPGSFSLPVTRTPSLAIEKTLSSVLPSPVKKDDILTFAFKVENTGNVTMRNIMVTDADATVVGGPIDLLPGESDELTFSATYQLTQDDINFGSFSNQAQVSGLDPTNTPLPPVSSDDPATVNPGDPTVTALPAAPSIELIKISDPQFGADNIPADGDVIQYAFVVRNTGNVTVSGIGIVDPSVTVAGGPTISLDPGQEDLSTFTASYQLNQADIDDVSSVFENQATAEGVFDGNPVVDISDSGTLADGPGDSDITVTLLGRNPKMSLTKSSSLAVSPNGAAVGDIITYSFTVENTGNVTLSDISIADAILTAPNADPTLPGVIATLAPGATASFADFEYSLTQADLDAGRVENTAQATAKQPSTSTDPALDTSEPVVAQSDDPNNPSPGPEDPTVTLIPVAPNVNVVKTATLNTDVEGDSSRADVGDTITYTFVVTNSGNQTLRNITVSDDKVEVIGGPIDLPAASVNGPPSTDSTTFQATYVLQQEDIDAGVYENTAEVSATTPDGTVIKDQSHPSDPEDDAPTVTTLPADNDFEVTKIASPLVAGSNGIVAGQTVNYTIAIENTGNTTLTGVDIVSDDLSQINGSDAIALTSGPSFVNNSGLVTASNEGTLLPGETANFTGTYTLTQRDIDAAGVTNTATGAAAPPGGLAFQSPSNPAPTAVAPQPSVETVKTQLVDQSSGLDASATDAGDVITYTMTVQNTGNTTLTAVEIASDSLSQINGTDSISLTTQPSFVENTGLTPPSAAGTLLPGETARFTATYQLTQRDVDAGGVSNIATGAGTPPNAPPVVDPSAPASTEIDVIPGILTTKTATVDQSAGLNSSATDADDVITYQIVIENTGNSTLTSVGISQEVLTQSGGANAVLQLTSGPDFVSNSGVNGGTPSASGSLLPTETATFTATYQLTQADVNAGGVTNTATGSGTPPNGGPINDPSDPTPVLVDAIPMLGITKEITSFTKLFPYVYEINYRVTVSNTGNVTQSNVQVTDDIASALQPGTLDSATVAISGFTGAGVANADFDGQNITETLSGNVVLQPATSGVVDLTARVNFSSGYAPEEQGNTAFASSDSITTPVASNDPGQTPGELGDVQPTPSPIFDRDNDGSPDNNESSTSDRDGDGIPDAQDYDPTGYFYCEENGQILVGGQITVTGPAGSQVGQGSSNNINILRDGADGSFQFFVTTPGRYVLSYQLPATGVASTDRLAGPAIDLTAFLPNNPQVIGGGQIGTTGILSDFSEAGNPFSTEFDIEAGDPDVFNLNIPLKFCATPQLTAGKQVVDQQLLADGASLVGYELSVTNGGLTRVSNVQLVDSLNTTFGAGNFEVSNVSITNNDGAAVALNTSYDGAASTNVLADNQILDPGQSAVVRLDVSVRVPASGDFTNTVTANGASPLAPNVPITTSSANATVSIVAGADAGSIVVTKAAARPTVRVGDVIPFTITIQNTGPLPRIGLRIVDRIPPGFVYRPGSAALDAVAFEPTRSGRRLVFDNVTVDAGQTRVLTLTLGMGAGATGTSFTNRAFAEDPVTGQLVSNVGTATVRREIEHVFDCGEIIGKVFDDKNGNGYQNKGEPGLPGVRVVTARGLLITTDKYGRYSVPCAAIPNMEIGSNFIMKLDKRTLPSGYRVTTENPRVVRLTNGKITKLNFGARLDRAVAVDLDARAFAGATREPNTALSLGLNTLVDRLEGRRRPSVRVTYRADGRPKLSKARLARVKELLRSQWKRAGGKGRLDIETRIVLRTQKGER